MTPTEDADEVRQLLERASRIDGSVDVDSQWAAGRRRLHRRRIFGGAVAAAVPTAAVVAFLTFGGEAPPTVPEQPPAGGVGETPITASASEGGTETDDETADLTAVTSTTDDPPTSPADEPDSNAVEVMVDPYIIASSASELADWGSHVVYAEVVDEREVKPRFPMALSEDQTAREVDLEIRDVLWSHLDAVTLVERGESVALEVSPGWVDGQPAVLEGTTRLEVGSTYLVTLVDTYDGGDQYLSYLFGSIQRADDQDAADLRDTLAAETPDPDRGPRPQEPWEARFIRGGGTSE